MAATAATVQAAAVAAAVAAAAAIAVETRAAARIKPAQHSLAALDLLAALHAAPTDHWPAIQSLEAHPLRS